MAVGFTDDGGVGRADMDWGCSSAGRAPALQAGGQRFDPAQLHHSLEWFLSLKKKGLRLFPLRETFEAPVLQNSEEKIRLEASRRLRVTLIVRNLEPVMSLMV